MSQAVNLHAVEPEPSAMPDVALLPDLVTYQSRFVDLPTSAHALIQATWLIHTWTFPVAFVTPYLYIHGKGPELGKTRNADTLATLARNPGSGTAAGQRIHVLAQKINASCPTLFFDETDRVFAGRANNPIAQLLNIGFERGGCYEYQRANEIQQWSVFCPKVLIGIQNNHLPATIWSRSIPVEMQPRKRELEHFNKYHLERDPQRLELCDRMAAFAEEFGVDVASQRPERIKSLGDRQNEISEPLLQIATVLGQEQQLRDALVRVFRSDGGAKSREQVLLSRIHAAFMLAQSDQISTEELLMRMGTFYTARTLQILLSEMGFERTQHDIRFGNRVQKGYCRSDFEPLFEKYLDVGSKLEVVDGGGS